MLPDKVFAEFSSNTPESQLMVKLAWPSLSTESKLQLISALQTKNHYTPTWMAELAAADQAPIVQFYAMRLPKTKIRRQNSPGEFPELLEDDAE